jgi:hypothetical protein
MPPPPRALGMAFRPGVSRVAPARPGGTDMAGPSWLAGAFAAVMIVTAAYSAGRLAISRLRGQATELDADAVHAVMGVAMAGMLMPQLTVLPDSAWAAVFGLAAAWFGWHAIRAKGVAAPGGSRCRYPVPHLIECAAMLYMLLPVHAPPPGRAGTGMAMADMSPAAGAAGSFPALAVVLALFMLGCIVWTTDRLAALARAGTTAPDQDTNRHRQPAAAVFVHGASSTLATPGTTVTRHEEQAARPMLAPRLATVGKLVMSITMGYMLILML